MAWVITAVGAALVEGAAVGTILTAVAAVGTTMSVVGLVTGNKDLTKIGGVLGLVGGLGSLAAGAFGAADGVAAEGAAASGGADAALSTSSDLSGNIAAAGGAGTDAAAAANAFGTDGITAANSAGDTSGLGSGLYNPPTDLSTGITPPTAGAPASSLTQAIPGAPAGTAPADPSATPIDPSADYGNTPALNADGTKSAAGQLWDSMTTKLGKIWDGMSPQAKAEIMKSALAIPGGIQAQQNKAAELALMQQNVNVNQQRVGQTAYGSQVPSFSLVQKAQAGS